MRIAQNRTTVRLVKSPEMFGKGVPTDGQPWIADWRSFDIPKTVVAGINATAPGCVAITLSMFGGEKMIYAAEAAARQRGMRVLWWFGPGVHELSDDVKERMRGWVRGAREAVTS